MAVITGLILARFIPIFKAWLITNINVMLTMLIGGLWHGAAWTFVFWGGLHGLYLCVNHAWRYVLERSGLKGFGSGLQSIRRPSRSLASRPTVAWPSRSLALVSQWRGHLPSNLGREHHKERVSCANRGRQRAMRRTTVGVRPHITHPHGASEPEDGA